MTSHTVCSAMWHTYYSRCLWRCAFQVRNPNKVICNAIWLRVLLCLGNNCGRLTNRGAFLIASGLVCLRTYSQSRDLYSLLHVCVCVCVPFLEYFVSILAYSGAFSRFFRCIGKSRAQDARNKSLVLRLDANFLFYMRFLSFPSFSLFRWGDRSCIALLIYAATSKTHHLLPCTKQWAVSVSDWSSALCRLTSSKIKLIQ